MNMPIKPIQLIIALAVLALSPLAFAEKFYKWQDENGVWHYDTKPPKGQEASALRVHSKSATPTEDEEIVKAEAEKLAKEEATAGTNAANCKAAKANLKIMTEHQQVTKDMDGDGVQEMMTPEQLRAETESTRKQVEIFCK